MADELHAYLYDKLIGTIRRDLRNPQRVIFGVTPNYDGPLSALSEGFSLTASRAPSSQQVSNFLGGYVPEGRHRTTLAAKKRLDENDLFGLLENYGLTMAGALSIRADEPGDDTTPAYRMLSHNDLKKKATKALSDFDLGNEPDSGRSTLPGFQPKLLLARFDGQWYQPLRLAHSTHIVKPELLRRPSAIHDEHYAYLLSQHMHLSSFRSEIVTLNGMTLLAIERYDRRTVGSESVVAIHQEDAAQVLGLDWVSSQAKFQDPARSNRPDRPTAARIAEIFGSIGTGDDVTTWLRYLIFNVLIGNHDGHAKNISLIHDDADSYIADLYDAVPILHINDDPTRVGSARLNDELALSINGVFAHHKVMRVDIEAEAGAWGALSSRRITDVVDDMFERFGLALDSIATPTKATMGLTPRLRYNLDQLASGKRIGKPNALNG